jgi:hypothetical protein
MKGGFMREGIGDTPDGANEITEIPSFEDFLNIPEPRDEYNLSPEERGSIADAMFERSQKDEAKWKQFLGKVESPDPLDEAIDNFNTRLEKIELHTRMANAKELVQPLDIVEQDGDKLLEDLRAIEYLDEGDVQHYFKDATDDVLLSQHGNDDIYAVLKFQDEVEAAIRHAEEAGCTVADVYNDDGLHRKLRQERDHPDALAVPGVGIDFHNFPADHKQDAKTKAIYQIVNTHGSEALESVQETYKNSLGINSGAITPELVEGAEVLPNPEQQRDADTLRTAFSKSFFVREGWDYRQPTDAQLDILKAQPTWINPFNPNQESNA